MQSSIFLDQDINEIVNLLHLNQISYRDLISASNKIYKSCESYLNAWAFYSGLDIEDYSDSCFNENLKGIPFGIKDIFNTANMPTQMGSPIWKNFTPGNNARVVDKLIWSGAIPIGKTVTAEFAVHHLNSTINPHNLEKTPGTSSSGSAAAVASGVVPFALGTQTAGSIIRPASFCGVWGMKPSFGMIPRTGVLKTNDSLDTIGFLTSRGKNLKVILDNMRVKGPNYPMVYKNIDNKKWNKSRWNIGFVKTHTWDYAESYVKDKVLEFVNKISDIDSIQINEIDWPDSLRNAHETHETIYTKSLGYYFKNEGHHVNDISQIMSKIIEISNTISSDQFKKALLDQENFILALDKLFKPYDMIISIGTSSSAPKRGEEEIIDPSLLWTLGHIPSVSVPLFRCPNRMPFSLQFISHKWGDYKIISIINDLIEKELISNESIEIEKNIFV